MSRFNTGITLYIRSDDGPRHYTAEVTATKGNEGFRLVIPPAFNPTTVVLDDLSILLLAMKIMSRAKAQTVGQLPLDASDFYEEDEPVEKIVAAYKAGRHGR